MKVEFLIPKLSFLTPGKTLFLNYMPDNIIHGLVILPSLMGGKIDPYVPNFKVADTFQIVSRDTDLVSSRDRALQASEALSVTLPENLKAASINQSSWKDICIVSCRPLQEPIVFPRPLDGAWESSVNFSINWYELDQDDA